MRCILVASPKGGCGKTTIATHLAAFYAGAGKETVLVDADPQASALRWAEKRAATGQSLTAVSARIGGKGLAKVPRQAKRVIVDAPAGIEVDRIEAMAEDLDALVIPVLPSMFDVEASEAFIERLAGLPAIRRGRLPVALVANRCRPWTQSTQAMLARLAQAPFPVIASLRDAQAYVLLCGIGRSLFDYQSEQVRQHQEDWLPLLRWIKNA